jgi:hypothetical protein
MLSTQNTGKYLTADYWRQKEAGELDKSNLSADDITFLEIQDGEAQQKHDIEIMREKADGILHV